MRILLYVVLSVFPINLFGQTNKPAKVFVNDNNIYLAFTSGEKKQLTFNGTDDDPILLLDQNKVTFVRGEKVGTYTKYKIMKVDIESLIESVITDQKPYQDGLDGTYEILNVITLTLSLDKHFLYFVTEKYATGNEFVKVDLNTGVWTELFSAENFELLDKDPYKGLFLVGVSQVGSKGRDVYYKLCDEKGDVKKEFDSRESLMQFRSKIK